MTGQHTHGNDEDQTVSSRLDRHQYSLDRSLDRALDIEAGLREILIHSRHDTAVDALDTVLDVESGLADILAPAPQPRAAETQHRPRAGSSLPVLSPTDRMALRAHPDVKAARLCLERHLDRDRKFRRAHADDLALAPGLAPGLALALARALAHTLARDLDLALERASELLLADNRDLIGLLSVTRRRASAFANDLNPNLDIGNSLKLARSVHVARRRARDLGLDTDIVFALILTRARACARDLAHTHELGRADTPNLDAFTKIRTNEVCRAIGLALGQEPPRLDADAACRLLDDFTHDDLRDADLTGLQHLSGVHWSQRTQWPPPVDTEALKARSDETPPGSGIWVVRSGTIRNFADLT
ncbi:hypothetical protein [Streptomyces sp. NPDC093225]|uniref:hypothetical protein n=1 Tax=Streptomyces sp. NPDC093225 TaxID=3366034 RepID=UPI00382F59E5